jgi:hypothetical protein
MDNQASSFETRRIHHGSGGLFIGAHKLLFALMNAVPTKTLLKLTHSALVTLAKRVCCNHYALHTYSHRDK